MSTEASPRRDTILFDVDGTLADSTYHHAIAWQRAFARQDLHPAVWRVQRAIGMGGDRLVTAVAGQDVEDRFGDALRAAWQEEYRRLVDEVTLLPGARELVLHLHDQGFIIAVASSGKHEFTQHVLDLLDLPEGVVATVTSSDDAEDSKPEPDILRVALQQSGGQAAVVIGDAPYDVTSAARLGAPCIGVRTGGFSEGELTEAGAVLVADEPQGLIGADWDDLRTAEPPRSATADQSPLPN